MSDKRKTQINDCCATAICLLLLLFSVVIVVIIELSMDVAEYYHEKHVIHKTNFTFTGNYLVVLKSNYYDSHFTTICESITPYNDSCYYNCYDTNVYQYAEQYGVDYCKSNVTLDGYLLEDKPSCVTSNPNKKIRVELWLLRILVIWTSLNIIGIIGIRIWNALKSKKEPNSYSNLDDVL